MIRNKKVLAIIPAREGSERLPGKNKKELKGKPLIWWTIETAMQSNYIDEIVVSSDDKEILNISKKLGANVLRRPKKLAGPDITMGKVVRNILKQITGYDIIILLQPTSPLRSIADIEDSLKSYIVSTCNRPLITIDQQDNHNGAIYIVNRQQVDWLDNTDSEDQPLYYVMPDYRSVDIDTEEDFKKAEELL